MVWWPFLFFRFIGGFYHSEILIDETERGTSLSACTADTCNRDSGIASGTFSYRAGASE
jgi:hypothetical protein